MTTKIPYTATKFSTLPLGSSTATKPASQVTTGTKSTTIAQLCAYAISVGDSSILSGGPRRPALEITWRMAMLQSSLEVQSGHFKRSDSYMRLDGSEKSAISYFLGMIQGSLMADMLLGTPVVVHVDQVLSLLNGKLPKASRPDLIGYTSKKLQHGTGRVLIEAKGRSNGFNQKAVSNALKQVKNLTPQVRRLLGSQGIGVASLSYFRPLVRRGTPMWTSYLEDPRPQSDSRSEFSDDEYRGLLLIGQLLPIALTIDELYSQTFGYKNLEGRIGVRLPMTETIVSLPSTLYEAVRSIDGPLKNSKDRERIARTVWEITFEADYRANDGSIDTDLAKKTQFLESGLAVSFSD